MTRRLQFKGWVILDAINWHHLERECVVQNTGLTHTFTHSVLIIFCLNQPPGPTCNLAASHRRSAGCKLLRWFYCPAAIKGVEPMTRSYRAHTSIHSIFISDFKKHWSHQNCFLTWKVGQEWLRLSWLLCLWWCHYWTISTLKYYSRTSPYIRCHANFFLSKPISWSLDSCQFYTAVIGIYAESIFVSPILVLWRLFQQTNSFGNLSKHSFTPLDGIGNEILWLWEMNWVTRELLLWLRVYCNTEIFTEPNHCLTLVAKKISIFGWKCVTTSFFFLSQLFQQLASLYTIATELETAVWRFR